MFCYMSCNSILDLYFIIALFFILTLRLSAIWRAVAMETSRKLSEATLPSLSTFAATRIKFNTKDVPGHALQTRRQVHAPADSFLKQDWPWLLRVTYPTGTGLHPLYSH
jgi:hypothetical protein